MKNLILVGLMALSSFSASAGDKVVENFYLSTLYNIRYNLSSYVYYCTYNDIKKCGLNEKEHRVLRKISSQITSTGQQVEFEISKDQSKFEIGNGAHRIAVTKLKPYSTIYFNANFFKSFETAPKISKLISIVVHEFGHHLGYTDNDERLLDRIGNAIEKFYIKNSQSIDLSRYGLPHIQLAISNYLPLYKKGNDTPFMKYKSFLAYASANLYTEHETIPWWNDYLDTAITSFPNVCKNRDHLQQFYVFNLRWNIPAQVKKLKEGDFIRAQADMKIYCGQTITSATLLNAKMEMFAQVVKKDGLLTFDWNKIRYETKPVEDAGGNSGQFAFGFNTKEISNGGLWHGKAKLNLTDDIVLNSCKARFESTSFPINYGGEPEVKDFEECTVQRADDGYIYFDFKYQIASNYKSGDYFFKEIEVTINNGAQAFSFAPPIKQKLTVKNSFEKAPINIIRTRLINKHNQRVTNIAGFNSNKDTVLLEVVLDRCHETIPYNDMRVNLDGRQVLPLNAPWASAGDTKEESTILSFSLYPDSETQDGQIGVIPSLNDLRCINGKGVWTLGFIIPPLGPTYVDATFNRIYFIANDLRVVDFRFPQSLILSF